MMARKSRRVKRKGRQVRLSASQMVQPIRGEGDAVSAVGVGHAPEVPDVKEEYDYVAADLVRLGIVAVSVFVLLVVLTLLLV